MAMVNMRKGPNCASIGSAHEVLVGVGGMHVDEPAGSASDVTGAQVCLEISTAGGRRLDDRWGKAVRGYGVTQVTA